jgi:hypothetical protein
MFSGMIHLNQLHERASEFLRMHERDPVSPTSDARGFVDQRRSFVPEMCLCGLDVVHGEGDVVHAFSVLTQETPNR